MTITGFTPSTKTDETVQRFEVFTGAGRRRDWSDEEKRQIVAESHSGEMSVSAVARRHGLSPGQLFTWRRQSRSEPEPPSPVDVRTGGDRHSGKDAFETAKDGSEEYASNSRHRVRD